MPLRPVLVIGVRSGVGVVTAPSLPKRGVDVYVTVRTDADVAAPPQPLRDADTLSGDS